MEATWMRVRLLAKVFSGALIMGFFLVPAVQAETGTPEKIFATVTKVDGNGTPKVRRMQGTEAVVGEKMEIFSGDRVITDDNSSVDILLHDGTIIRVGIHSEFRLDSAALKKGFIAWIFSLAEGSIRGLVEKSADQKNIKLRVNTPSGTIGVRGTEFVLEHVGGQTSLFTIEGDVAFGEQDCDSKGSCVHVTSGNTSVIRAGGKAASPPKKFTTKEIVGLGKQNKQRANLLALFQGAKANPDVAAKMSDQDLDGLVKKAELSFQEAQDRFLGRDAAGRKAMHKAMVNGTFQKVVAVADAYEYVTGKERAGENNTSFFSPVVSRKFLLGNAIVQSPIFSGEQSSAVSKKAELDLAGPMASLQKATLWAEEIKKKPPPAELSTATATSTSVNTAIYTNATYGAQVIPTRQVVANDIVQAFAGAYESYKAQYIANKSACDGYAACAVQKTFYGADIIKLMKTFPITAPVKINTKSVTSISTATSAERCVNPVRECSFVPCQTYDPITKKVVACKAPKEEKCVMKCP
jgi:hypothetical protein